jgi:hypothetical protein
VTSLNLALFWRLGELVDASSGSGNTNIAHLSDTAHHYAMRIAKTTRTK